MRQKSVKMFVFGTEYNQRCTSRYNKGLAIRDGGNEASYLLRVSIWQLCGTLQWSTKS